MAEPESVMKLLERLPPRPPESLDRALDAAQRCLARYGIRRTSMSDIAREMKVARTTLYRQIASVEEAIALLASRDFHRFVDDLVASLASPYPGGSGAFVDAIAGAVRWAWSHPVAARVLSDEPDILGELVTRDLRVYASHTAAALTPILEEAMQAGILRPADPHLAAEWLVRVVAVLIALPPAHDLNRLVEFALSPVLVEASVPVA